MLLSFLDARVAKLADALDLKSTPPSLRVLNAILFCCFPASSITYVFGRRDLHRSVRMCVG
jgi:hypothetical protein